MTPGGARGAVPAHKIGAYRPSVAVSPVAFLRQPDQLHAVPHPLDAQALGRDRGRQAARRVLREEAAELFHVPASGRAQSGASPQRGRRQRLRPTAHGPRRAHGAQGRRRLSTRPARRSHTASSCASVGAGLGGPVGTGRPMTCVALVGSGTGHGKPGRPSRPVTSGSPTRSLRATHSRRPCADAEPEDQRAAGHGKAPPTPLAPKVRAPGRRTRSGWCTVKSWFSPNV